LESKKKREKGEFFLLYFFHINFRQTMETRLIVINSRRDYYMTSNRNNRMQFCNLISRTIWKHKILAKPQS